MVSLKALAYALFFLRERFFYFSYRILACRWFEDYSPNSEVVGTLHEYNGTIIILTVVSAF